MKDKPQMEIELYSKLQNPIDAIDRIGEMFAKSGMFGCDRLEQGKVLAMICLTERKSPVDIVRSYHIIDGKLSKKSLAALADFRRLGGKHRWIATGDDGQRAEGEFTFDGQTIRVAYSMDDARRQCVSFKPGSNWVKSPSNMLRARVVSNAIGMLAPEIFAGDDSDNGDAPAGPAINLATTATVSADSPQPAPSKQPAVASPSIPEPPAIDVESEKVEASMGLAPVAPQPPPAAAPTFAKGPKTGTGALGDSTVEEIGAALAGSFLPAARWLLKEGWLKGELAPEATEGAAGAFLQSVMPTLSPSRAKRILTQRESFLRAIKEVK